MDEIRYHKTTSNLLAPWSANGHPVLTKVDSLEAAAKLDASKFDVPFIATWDGDASKAFESTKGSWLASFLTEGKRSGQVLVTAVAKPCHGVAHAQASLDKILAPRACTSEFIPSITAAIKTVNMYGLMPGSIYSSFAPYYLGSVFLQASGESCVLAIDARSLKKGLSKMEGFEPSKFLQLIADWSSIIQSAQWEDASQEIKKFHDQGYDVFAGKGGKCEACVVPPGGFLIMAGLGATDPPMGYVGRWVSSSKAVRDNIAQLTEGMSEASKAPMLSLLDKLSLLTVAG